MNTFTHLYFNLRDGTPFTVLTLSVTTVCPRETLVLQIHHKIPQETLFHWEETANPEKP